MRKVLGFTVFLCLMVSNFTASAGVKEAGGDESVLFKCVSAPYVDSNFIVFGVSKEVENGIELVVFSNGKFMGQDDGVLNTDDGQYVGEIFDIQFSSTELEPSTITAKLDSSVLQASGTDLLFCEFSK